MRSYQYEGDHPVDVPEFSLERVQPGDKVTVAGEINHSDFKLIVERKSAKTVEG